MSSVVKKYLALPPPSLNDQRSDSQRLADFLPYNTELVELTFLRELPGILRKGNYQVSLIFNHQKLIGLEPGNTTATLYGIAVDIGTTTIAAYLLDLLTGRKIATYSCLNPQRKYGADVISRINFTMENPNGLEVIHRQIIDTLNLAVEDLTTSAGLKGSDVYHMVCVGNTVRELQSAKAAVAAGINVLLKKAGLDLMDIKRVYLAGGFGSYINIESALNIGGIPSKLRGRIVSIGNSAGIGAMMNSL